MEPHYECNLCGNQGITKGMFSHIMGKTHRQNYMEKTMIGVHQTQFFDLSQSELLHYAKEFAENTSDLTKRIQTRRSDEYYPSGPEEKDKGGCV